jgi:hypothetical protein
MSNGNCGDCTNCCCKAPKFGDWKKFTDELPVVTKLIQISHDKSDKFLQQGFLFKPEISNGNKIFFYGEVEDIPFEKIEEFYWREI